eukprot:TRINITY_DN3902_c0_g1_i2.p1 TRINITY_DN3902_c0_g1~~TRINITY_DN3902_c0_g1_i2.p1  ORF type:complete len:220 (+),score=20.63 TRINITY_DN3902_c0_g1_i2:186-845(+)
MAGISTPFLRQIPVTTQERCLTTLPFPQVLYSQQQLVVARKGSIATLKRTKLSRGRPLNVAASVTAPADQEDEEFMELTFIERILKAWRILFPPRSRPPSIAEIGKERLRFVLFSDRTELSPEIRNRLRWTVIEAIQTYVEIESEDDVQLNVTADPDIGTVYSVTVPVRRIRPEYQEYWSEGGFRDRMFDEIVRTQQLDGERSLNGELRLEAQFVQDDE